MGFTHFDENGKAFMVDVTNKKETVRTAEAVGTIKVSKEVYEAVKSGTVGKGDVLGVATTAGIMGAKHTSDLIPMCHILPITNCSIQFELDPEEYAIHCTCTVKVTGKTGVEMEALTESALHCLLSMICARQLINQWKSAAFICAEKPEEKAEKL